MYIKRSELTNIVFKNTSSKFEFILTREGKKIVLFSTNKKNPEDPKMLSEVVRLVTLFHTDKINLIRALNHELGSDYSTPSNPFKFDGKAFQMINILNKFVYPKYICKTGEDRINLFNNLVKGYQKSDFDNPDSYLYENGFSSIGDIVKVASLWEGEFGTPDTDPTYTETMFDTEENIYDLEDVKKTNFLIDNDLEDNSLDDFEFIRINN